MKNNRGNLQLSENWYLEGKLFLKQCKINLMRHSSECPLIKFPSYRGIHVYMNHYLISNHLNIWCNLPNHCKFDNLIYYRHPNWYITTDKYQWLNWNLQKSMLNHNMNKIYWTPIHYKRDNFTKSMHPIIHIYQQKYNIQFGIEYINYLHLYRSNLEYQ